MSKTALITGASAGLGAELAALFAADGHDLVLVARRRDRLEALARDLAKKNGVRAEVLAEDLTDPGAPARIAAELTRLGLDIEFLVNNAAFGTSGPFAALDPARELAQVQLNVAAVVHLTRLFLPAMIARGSGRLLHLGSSAGFVPGPFMADYYASKAFVNSFGEALSRELWGTGVTSTVSCPGPTATEFAAVAGIARSPLFRMGTMTSGEVARHAYRAMMRGRALAIPGWRNKLMALMLRVTPRWAARGLAARLNRAPPALSPA